MDMVKFFVIDVDGTMTDGGVYYDECGNELKKFCTKDAAAYFALKSVGIKTVVLTGRECLATKRRMSELHIDYVFQNIKNKALFLTEFMHNNNIESKDFGYIGDDLNDLPSMILCGFKGCPSDACKEIKLISDYISCNPGGCGAVRDIVEHYLESFGKWEYAITNVYKLGI